jgi:predicted lipid-binding transport protein (Tim44 family)
MNRKAIAVLCVLVVTLVVVAAAPAAWARLGGGEGFGGGGGGGDGGGGDGGIFDLIFFLLYLCIECPCVGIPLLIIVIIIGIVSAFSKKKTATEYSSRLGTQEAQHKVAVRNVWLANSLAQLKKDDPNFSGILFADFIQLLYARVVESRATGNYASLMPFLTPQLAQRFAGEKPVGGLQRTSNVVVGAARIQDISIGPLVFITAEFESNYTEHREGGQKVVIYAREFWTFRRKRGALSKSPEDIATLSCPSCGAAVELKPDGSCTYCGKVVTDGTFHWQVSNIRIAEMKPQEPMSVTKGGGEEGGTDLPTIFHPDYETNRKLFMGRYPDFVWPAFLARVQDVFLRLQQAWSTKDFELARPYETDSLFNMHRYWIENYRASGLTNKLDAYFEGVTVRIWASCLDYTVDSTGKVVSGSNSKPRRFSEYWTFVRRVGFTARQDTAIGNCPNCGAELKVSASGLCEYCNTKITSGQFDWVLAVIQQDDVYEG